VAGYLFTADAIETDDQASRQSQVDALIDGFEPWEVAQTVRLATLLAVPTLDQLIGHLGAWQWEEDRLDTVTWLEVHAGDRAPWKKLAYANLQRDALQPRSLYVRSPEDLVGALTPPELLTAWHNVVGPAPSDLSEAEWMLLMPSLPKGGPTSPMTETRLVRIRRNLDGMLYRFANKAAWSEVPERYGKNQSILARYTNYKRRGVFAQALASLEHDPSSARLMEWLRSVG
jgi:putative transposase